MLLLPLPCSGNSFLENFLTTTTILPNDEIRAAWVVRHALNSREDVDLAIDYAVRARFHLLFVQVRGRADAYYQSSLEPDGPGLSQSTENFDPLRYLLLRAHDEGIAVHAWVNVFYVWSNGSKRPPAGHVVNEHPEWLMTDDSGTRMDKRLVDEWRAEGLEGYYVSPGNPNVRKHIANVVREIVTLYPVDGVHLDYVRYPGAAFDFSPASRTEFTLRYGIDPLDIRRQKGELSSIFGEETVGLLDSLHVAWRSAQVDTLISMVRSVIGSLPLSVAAAPDIVTAHRDKGQDWVGWVQRRDISFVVPMAYTYLPDELQRYVRTLKRSIGTGYFLVGLPVFDGRDSYLGYSIPMLREEEVLGYALFSYNALAEKRFSLKFLETVFFGEDEAGDADEDDELGDDVDEDEWLEEAEE